MESGHVGPSPLVDFLAGTAGGEDQGRRDPLYLVLTSSLRILNIPLLPLRHSLSGRWTTL